MKILIIVDDYRGGAGNIAQILAKELKKLKYEMYLMTLNHHSEKRYDLSEITIFDYKNRNKYTLLSTIRIISRYIKNNKIDLVISFLSEINILVLMSVFFNTKIPVIVSERNDPIGIKLTLPWNILQKITYYRANLITVQFEDFKFFMGNKISRKVVTTPNIILEPKFIRKSKKSFEKINFISNARLNPVKQFDLMIKAFRKVVDKCSNVELHIYGDGSEKLRLLNLINEMKLTEFVFLHDHTNDVYLNLKDSDIYLMTSKHEGFPNALSEALAVGLPAVVFECHSGINKLVKNDFNGYVVKNNNIDLFAQKCIYLCEKSYLIDEFGLNSRKIVEKYKKDKVIDIWIKCISKVSNGGK